MVVHGVLAPEILFISFRDALEGSLTIPVTSAILLKYTVSAPLSEPSKAELTFGLMMFVHLLISLGHSPGWMTHIVQAHFSKSQVIHQIILFHRKLGEL